jgi:methylated-DNA-protein-cysteine methyltransferase-like protein
VNERERQMVRVIRALRPGEVVSYGDVAADAGHPRQARLVGRVLALGAALDPSAADLPWWRVVTADGRLVPGLELEQAVLLREEGVVVSESRVERARWGRFSPGQRP